MKTLASSIVAISSTMIASKCCRVAACRSIPCAFLSYRAGSNTIYQYSQRSFHASVRAGKKASSQSISSGGGVKKHRKKQPGLFRADRVLSNRGVGTRSQTSKLLRQRRIAVFDPDTGQRVGVKGPSEKIHPKSTLYLDGKELPGPPPVILIYHKPKYVLSAMHDNNRSHLGEKLEECNLFSTRDMHPVGRLDYETTGLILFSSSGDLTQRLLHPRQGIEKEYLARVEGIVDEDKLRNRLNCGVKTAEGVHKAELLEVTPVSVTESSSRDGDNENEKDTENNDSSKEAAGTDLTDVRIVVTEGKHRMVRRMLANCGHPVIELKRERHGEVRLKDLPVGEFRAAIEKEIVWAESLLQ